MRNGSLGRKGLDNATFGYRAATALIDDAAELAAERPEAGDFSVDVGQMLPRDGVHRTAGTFLLIGKAQKVPYIVERKPKTSRAADEAQPAEMSGLI